MREDLTMVPTERLPAGLEHVQFPATPGHLAAFRAMERAGQVERHGSMVRTGGTVYTTVRRNAPQPVHRAPAPRWLPWVVGAVAFVGLAGLVSWLVRTMTSAVSQAGPAVGFVVAASLVLFGTVAWRTRKGRTVEVRTVTRVRVR